MLTDNKYVVYEVTPRSSGQADRALAAVFVIKDGKFHLLEDYTDLFSQFDKDGMPIEGQLARRINSVIHSSYLHLSTASQDRGDRPDPVLPKLKEPDHQSFTYQHKDMHAPVPLVFSNGHFFLNGSPVSIEELEEMHNQAASGEAKITYPQDLFKAEEASRPVQASGMDMDRDYNYPDVRNLHAYKKFMETEPKGMHIFVRTEAVEKILEEEGATNIDKVQTSISNMLFEAAEGNKVFHIGRDSYYVFVPTYEDGAKFISNLEAIVEHMPVIHAHHPYFDVGMSDDVEGAFDALHMTANFKIMNDGMGNHVVINTDHNFKYIPPSGI